MKLSQFRMSISVRLALIQILTAFSILVLFLIVLFGSGFTAVQDTVVILFSANPDYRTSVSSCGADDFLAKPFKKTELLNAIQKNLALNSGMRA